MSSEVVLISQGSISKSIAEVLKDSGIEYRGDVVHHANQSLSLSAGSKRKSKRRTYNLKEVQ